MYLKQNLMRKLILRSFASSFSKTLVKLRKTYFVSEFSKFFDPKFSRNRFFRKDFEKPFEKSVFRNFGKDLGELETNGPQNQLPHQILLQIRLSRGLCDPKSRKNDSYPASASPIATSGAWFGLGPNVLSIGGGLGVGRGVG